MTVIRLRGLGEDHPFRAISTGLDHSLRTCLRAARGIWSQLRKYVASQMLIPHLNVVQRSLGLFGLSVSPRVGLDRYRQLPL
jgi:hypothetical protein